MKKFVITGGPGVGKTSTIEDLKKKGYYIVSETAREIIEEQLKANGKILPWLNLDSFNLKIIELQEKKEKSIPEKIKLAFLDRGIIDCIGYYKAEKRLPIKEVAQAAKNTSYDKVFMLDPLPCYVKDDVRKEDEKKAILLHKEIEKAYEEAGVPVTKVPVASINERTKFILEKIK